MKEFIQRIRTLDEAEMRSPRLFYTTIPASTVGTRNGLAEVPDGHGNKSGTDWEQTTEEHG
jgi:hypothetical protein